MRYFLLLKRNLKKKSYICMLLAMALLVVVFKSMSYGDASIMSVGVYAPGSDETTNALIDSLNEDPGAIHYYFYADEKSLREDIDRQHLTEGWVLPEDMDGLVAKLASNDFITEKIEILIPESGLSHLLGREILAARVYRSVAREVLYNYLQSHVYDGLITDTEKLNIDKIFLGLPLDDSIFEMGYVDGDAGASDDSILLMPLRGILALWLFLCGIAAAMYYIQDMKNGLFVWWNMTSSIISTIGYYAVIFLVPSVIVLWALYYCGVFTSCTREVAALLLYVFCIIFFSMILVVICRKIEIIGILTPVLTIVGCLLSPVFVDFKELRGLQMLCPTFHYMCAIHDDYYLRTLAVYAVLLWCLVVLLFKLPVKMRQVFKAHLL